MRVNNPDRSPARIHAWDTPQLQPALLRLSVMKLATWSRQTSTG